MAKNKPIKIEFAPGCFDDFEGTQEELDELIGTVTEMFANLTPEELMAQSQEVDIDALLEEDPEFAEALLAQVEAAKEKSVADRIDECKTAKADAIRKAAYNTKRTLH